MFFLIIYREFSLRL